MRWPPWRRRRKRHVEDGNGHAARKAKADAAEAVKQAKARWPEVHAARNVFADQVASAMRHRRQA